MDYVLTDSHSIWKLLFYHSDNLLTEEWAIIDSLSLKKQNDNKIKVHFQQIRQKATN